MFQLIWDGYMFNCNQSLNGEKGREVKVDVSYWLNFLLDENQKWMSQYPPSLLLLPLLVRIIIISTATEMYYPYQFNLLGLDVSAGNVIKDEVTGNDSQRLRAPGGSLRCWETEIVRPKSNGLQTGPNWPRSQSVKGRKSGPTCCLCWAPPPAWPPSLPPSRSSVCKRRNSRLNVHSPGTFTMELRRQRGVSGVSDSERAEAHLAMRRKTPETLLFQGRDSGGHGSTRKRA